MPTVAELTAPYGNFMVGPRRGPEMCAASASTSPTGTRAATRARTASAGSTRCARSRTASRREQLHHVLRGYKRRAGATARRFTVELAAVLWRHLEAHERCVARAARHGVSSSSPRCHRARGSATSTTPFAGSSASSWRRLAVATSGCSDVGRRLQPTRIRPRKVRDDARAGRQLRAADRRHVDDRRQRPERRRGPQEAGAGTGRCRS